MAQTLEEALVLAERGDDGGMLEVTKALAPLVTTLSASCVRIKLYLTTKVKTAVNRAVARMAGAVAGCRKRAMLLLGTALASVVCGIVTATATAWRPLWLDLVDERRPYDLFSNNPDFRMALLSLLPDTVYTRVIVPWVPIDSATFASKMALVPGFNGITACEVDVRGAPAHGSLAYLDCLLNEPPPPSRGFNLILSKTQHPLPIGASATRKGLTELFLRSSMHYTSRRSAKSSRS